MEINKLRSYLLIACLSALLFATPTLAQTEELLLRVTRDFGFSSGTGRIQGTFSMNASGPANLTRVVFLIDGETMGEATQAPFKLRFNTGDYPLGVHTLSATGYTADGQEVHSNEYRQEFVSAQAGWQSAGKIVIPLIGIVVLMMLFGYLLPTITSRGKKVSLPLGAPRTYGLGGGICPKCGRPFGFHIYGLNLLMRKYDRCPYCGKWSPVKRASMQELREAEAAELNPTQNGATIPQESAEDELRRQIDESRFQDR